MNTRNTLSSLDVAEIRRRRELVARAAGGVGVDLTSEKGRLVKKISDNFIYGSIDQTAFITQLKAAIRGESAGGAG